MSRRACMFVCLSLGLAGACELPLEQDSLAFCSADGQTCGLATDCYSRCYCDTEDTTACESRCGPRGARVQDLDQSDWPSDWVAFEDDVIALVNEARAQGGCCGSYGCFGPTPPLSRDDRLRSSAREHALDMAEQNYFSHDSLDGREASDRIQEALYRGCALAENIAAGARTPEEVMQGWLDSPGHCNNLLSDAIDLEWIGVGYAEGDGDYPTYWVQNFGG